LIIDGAAGRPSAELLQDLRRIERIACAGDHSLVRSLLFEMIDEKKSPTRVKKTNGHQKGGPRSRREMQASFQMRQTPLGKSQ
jgi:hypothetical protein